MDWIAPIQKITEKKITEKKTLEADKKKSRDEDAKFMEGSVKGKEGKRIGFEAEGSIMGKRAASLMVISLLRNDILMSFQQRL